MVGAVETFGSVDSDTSQCCALTQPAPCIVVEHKDKGLTEVSREREQEPWAAQTNLRKL